MSRKNNSSNKPASSQPDDIELAVIDKSERAQIRIVANQWEGKAYIHVREYVMLRGEWQRTAKGVSMPVVLWPFFAKAVTGTVIPTAEHLAPVTANAKAKGLRPAAMKPDTTYWWVADSGAKVLPQAALITAAIDLWSEDRLLTSKDDAEPQKGKVLYRLRVNKAGKITCRPYARFSKNQWKEIDD